MDRIELMLKVDALIAVTREALQLVYDTLNEGQRNKILKEKAVKELFDRYGVKY